MTGRAGLCLAGLLAASLAAPVSLQAQKKEIIELQTTVALLQQQVGELQRSLVDRTAVLKTLVEQAVDAVNRMQNTVIELEQTVKQAQANSGARVDSLATEVRALRDTVDELGVRVAKLSEQLAETQNVLQTVDARLAAPPPSPTDTGQPAQPAATPQPSSPPPSADTLYSSGKRDFDSGKHDLARQQFLDYLRYYGQTLLAGNAQFYIGEIYYQQKEYAQAVEAYDKVLTSYPKSYKVAAAQLKKGFALIRLNEREAGIRALRAVLREHANTNEAKLARDELRRLGVSSNP